MGSSMQSEADWITQRRFPNNFIPRYANGYFDRRLEMRAAMEYLFLAFPRFTLLGLGMIGLFEINKSKYILFMFAFAMAIWFVNNIILPPLRSGKLGVGYLLVPDGIYELGANQKLGRLYSYEKVRHAIEKGAYHYLSDRLVIDCGSLKLSFYFENGDAYAYAHTKKVYALLGEKLQMQLPLLTDEMKLYLDMKEKIRQKWFVFYVLGIIIPFITANLLGYATMYDVSYGLLILSMILFVGFSFVGIYQAFLRSEEIKSIWLRLRQIEPSTVKGRWVERFLTLITALTILFGIAFSIYHIVFFSDFSEGTSFRWDTSVNYIQVSKAIDNPNEYHVLVTPREDGSVYLTYHVTRRVRAAEGVKELDFAVPNSFVKEVISLSPTAKYISYTEDEDGVGKIHIGFDRLYQKDECYTLDFQYRVLCLYEKDDVKGEYRYFLAPDLIGWVSEEQTTILWDATYVDQADGQLVSLDEVRNSYLAYEQMIQRAEKKNIWSGESIEKKDHGFYLWRVTDDGDLHAAVCYRQSVFPSHWGILYRRLYMNPVRWMGLLLGTVIPLVSYLVAISFALQRRKNKVDGISQKKEETMLAEQLLQEEKVPDRVVLRQITVNQVQGGVSEMDEKQIEENEAADNRKKWFLPKQSNFEMEYALAKRTTGINVLLVSFFFLIVLFMTAGVESRGVQAAIVCWCLIFFKVCIIDPLIVKAKKDDGYVLDPGGIRYVRKEEDEGVFYDYDLVREAIEEGRIRYKKTALEIDCKKFVLRFFYEVGETAAFKHILKCYDILKQRINMELPPLDAKLTGFMDQKFFHRKKIKLGFILEIIGEFFCMIMVSGGPLEMTGEIAFCATLFSIMTYVGVFFILRASLWLKRITRDLRKEYEKAATDSWFDQHAWEIAVANFILIVGIHVLYSVSLLK